MQVIQGREDDQRSRQRPSDFVLEGILPVYLHSCLVFISCALALFLSVTGLSQELYKWKDEKGQWHISDKPPSKLPAQPQLAPSLEHGDASRLDSQDERASPTKSPSQDRGGLVYDRVICREQLPRNMYVAATIVRNVSGHTVTTVSSARFFDPAGRLFAKKDNPAVDEERLEPGQKRLVGVTISVPLGSSQQFPPLGFCHLDVRAK